MGVIGDQELTYFFLEGAHKFAFSFQSFVNTLPGVYRLLKYSYTYGILIKNWSSGVFAPPGKGIINKFLFIYNIYNVLRTLNMHSYKIYV